MNAAYLSAGMRKILVFETPFVSGLEGIVRPVDGPVDEERLGLVPRDEALALVHHHVPEVFPVPPNFLSLLPKIVPVGAVPIEEVRIVVDAPSHVAERIIEALAVGHGLGRITEVPFPNVTSRISI